MTAPAPVLPATAKPWLRLPADPGAPAPVAAASPGASASDAVPPSDAVHVEPTSRRRPKAATPAREYGVILETAPAAASSAATPGPAAPPAPAAAALTITVALEEPSLPSSSEPAGDGGTVAPAPGGEAAMPGSAGAALLESLRAVESERAASSPFRASRKAAGAVAPGAQRLKLFLFGDTGTGKTLTALQFPRPAVLDLEAGVDAYEDSFAFTALDKNAFGGARANDWERLGLVVDYLLAHPEVAREIETLIIDPITVAWEACMDLWTARFLARRGVKAAGNKVDFYDLQPADWRLVKGDLKGLFRKLARLDMHVVATAREKPLYAEGAMMRRIGETFDAERNLPYYFDLAARLQKHPTEPEMFCATVAKSRNFLLSRPSYVYRGALGFGQLVLSRLRGEPEPLEVAIADTRTQQQASPVPLADIGPVGFDGEVTVSL